MRSLIFGAGVMLGVCLGSAALAQDKPLEATTQVEAFGSIETAPGVATITYTVRGEGKSADEATRALVARKDAVAAALGGVDATKIDALTLTFEILR